MADRIRAASPAVIEFAETNNIDLSKVAGTGPDGRVSLEDVKAAMPEPYVTPLVAQMAAQHGIDLRNVQGSGVGGRIRKDDVLRAAGKLPPVQVPSGAALSDGDRQAQEIIAMFRDIGAVRPRPAPSGGAYARNPLGDAAAASLHSAGVQPTSAAPTLFPGGDEPSFTASGIPVGKLADVPACARHALAAAPTRAAAYEIYDKCTVGEANMSGEQVAKDYDIHPGYADYEKRVRDWHAEQAEALIDEDAWLAQLEQR